MMALFSRILIFFITFDCKQDMQKLIVFFFSPLRLKQHLVLEGIDSFEKRLQVN